MLQLFVGQFIVGLHKSDRSLINQSIESESDIKHIIDNVLVNKGKTAYLEVYLFYSLYGMQVNIR